MKSFFFLFFAVTAAVHAAPSVKDVLELDKIQPYAPLAFHADRMWTAQSKTEGDKTVYDLMVYDAQGTLLAGPKRVPHTMEHIYPFGANRVLVIGKSSWPWKTHYTIATAVSETVTLKTTTFPEAIQTEMFGGTPERMFFNDPGDRKVFQWNGKSAPLNHEISGPGNMALLYEDFLFVLERRSIYLGDEDIYRIDLRSGEGKRVFSEHRQGITQLLPIPSRGLLAASEGLADQVLLVDVKSNELKATFAVPGGTPRGLGELGHCLVVGSDVAKKISFLDLNSNGKVVAEWDLSQTDKPLFNIFSIAVDPRSGNVFARAKDICASCTVSRNRVVLATDGGEAARACGVPSRAMVKTH